MKNQKLQKQVRELPCLACLPNEQKYPSEADHITTRGAGGVNEENNVWPLCTLHHRLRHSKGLGYIVNNYSQCKEWLINHDRGDVLSRVSDRL
jgi:hypothetical protein